MQVHPHCSHPQAFNTLFTGYPISLIQVPISSQEMRAEHCVLVSSFWLARPLRLQELTKARDVRDRLGLDAVCACPVWRAP